MPIVKIDLGKSVPIVGDGGIGDPRFGDGRIIPVLVIDCVEHRALYELIFLHEKTPPGDVLATWGRKIFNKKNVYLSLEFQQPVRTHVSFRFSLDRQAGLVDGIIRSRGVYLQPIESGRTVSEGLGKAKIVVEIPPTATFPEWPALHHRATVSAYRKNGATRKQANELAKQHIARFAEIWGGRQRRGVDLQPEDAVQQD